MPRLIKVLLLIALVSPLQACSNPLEEDEYPLSADKIVAYLEERHETGAFPLEQPLAIIIAIETQKQEEEALYLLCDWELSNGLQGSLKLKTGVPIAQECQLKAGKNALQLVFATIKASLEVPRLRLTVQNKAQEKEVLQIDLTSVLLPRVAHLLQGVQKQREALDQSLLPLTSPSSCSLMALQQDAAEARYKQSKLVEKLAALKSTLELCGSEQDRVQELCHGLEKEQASLQKGTEAAIVHLEASLQLQATYKRGSNEFQAVTGFTPLQEAIHKGDEGALKALLSHGDTAVDKHNKDHSYGVEAQKFPLMQVCEKGSIGMLRLLLEAGANPNYRYEVLDEEGDSAYGEEDSLRRWLVDEQGFNHFKANEKQQAYDLLIAHGWRINKDEDEDALKEQGISLR